MTRTQEHSALIQMTWNIRRSYRDGGVSQAFYFGTRGSLSFLRSVRALERELKGDK